MDPSKQKCLEEKVVACKIVLNEHMHDNHKWFNPNCGDQDEFDKWNKECLDITCEIMYTRKFKYEINLQKAIDELNLYNTVDQPKQAAAEYAIAWGNAPTLSQAYKH